jgi:hypothetical protein
MGIFTSTKRHIEQAALTQGQNNVNRLRMFLPIIAAGLDSEGYNYAQRAVGLLVAIAGWPSLVTFIYQLGSVECDIAGITNEDEGWRVDRAVAETAARLLLRAYSEPLALADLQYIRAVACVLMVWWGLAAEPQHPIVRLMQHFGGHPFKTNNVQEIERRFSQIRSRITPETQKVWKWAEQEMSAYSSGLPAA